jgi:hypothetical protein
MATNDRSENKLISLFLSAYDDDTWQGCEVDWLDQRIRCREAVEALATRRSDGATLAIEHTLIQPYDKHKEEVARWARVFGVIQSDPDLVVPNRGVDVYLASGTLTPGCDWRSISSDVHNWLRTHVNVLPVGLSHHRVEPKGYMLRIQVVQEQYYDGDFQFGIDGSQLPDTRLHMVVEKALKTKVGKLADTTASKRILMLERDEWTIQEDSIAAVIESLQTKSTVDRIDQVDEIWFADTVLSFQNYIRFSRYGHTAFMEFFGGRLRRRWPKSAR